jgi:hypothetical protein
MSEKPQEKIIDAEAEPLAKPGSGRGWRILLYLLGAVLLSVAVAVGYEFATSGKLATLFDSAPPVQTTSQRQAAPAPVVTAPPAPTAAAPVAAAPSSAAPVSDARVEDLEKRLGMLTASLERLQQLPAANAIDPQKLTDLDQQVTALRAALDTATAQRTALQTQIAEMQGRLTALSEARVNALREPLVQLIAWNELRERARRGDSFAREATALGQYAEAQGGNLKTAFAALQPFAEQPAPAALALAARFPALAEQQRAAPAQADAAAADRAWWQRAVDKLSGLVSIRRTGTADAATLEGRLDLAEAALMLGDLKAAAAALENQPMGIALSDWRDQAQARLRLDAALDDYGATLRGHLAVH